MKRALEKRESKIYENDKTAVFVRGSHTSEIVTQFLSELVLFSLEYLSFYIAENVFMLAPVWTICIYLNHNLTKPVSCLISELCLGCHLACGRPYKSNLALFEGVWP